EEPLVRHALPVRLQRGERREHPGEEAARRRMIAGRQGGGRFAGRPPVRDRPGEPVRPNRPVRRLAQQPAAASEQGGQGLRRAVVLPAGKIAELCGLEEQPGRSRGGWLVRRAGGGGEERRDGDGAPDAPPRATCPWKRLRTLHVSS